MTIILRKSPLEPFAQRLPEGELKMFRHDFNRGDAVFLRRFAALPEAQTRRSQ